MDSLVPTTRPPRQARNVHRAWASEGVFRDVAWESSATALAASKSVTANRLSVDGNRAGKCGRAPRRYPRPHQPAQLLEQRRRQRPLSASYATSNRAAGVQKRQSPRRPQSADPARSDADAPGVARPQSAGALRQEMTVGYSQDAAVEPNDASELRHAGDDVRGFGRSPIRTRDARARRPNSANASIRWLQPLASAGSAVRPASAAGRMQGGARRVWDGYNIYCPRPDPVGSDDGEEQAALMQAQLLSQARNGSTIVIQCAYRIHLALRTVAQRRQLAAQNRAARKLQAQSRGWLTRRRRKMEGLAAIRLQALWRGHAGRRKAKDAADKAAAEVAAKPFVPPPWGQKETEVLMMLCEREGLGSWTRKALQLGGRRTAEELNHRYFWVLRQRKVADEKIAAQAEAKRQEEAAVAAEEKSQRARLRKERAAEAKRSAAAKRFSAGGASNDRRAVWATGDTHNNAVAYKLSEEAKREAAEGAILEVLLRMLKGEKTLYGQKMGSAAEAFKLLDQDGSGQLDLQELTDGLKRLGLGLTDAQISRLALTLDADNSGEISVDEFVDGLETAVKARKARAEQLRRRLGRGNDGGRVTEYPRPWTERPADLTPMQLLQRAAKKAAVGRMLGKSRAGGSNRENIEKALKYCCLNGDADQQRLNVALAAIETSEMQASAEADSGEEPKPRRYVLLLTADAKLKYRALYWLQHPDIAAQKKGGVEVRGLRIAGSGPPRLRGDAVAMTLTYDAAIKCFKPTLTEEELAALEPDHIVSLGDPALPGGVPLRTDAKAFDAVTLKVKKMAAISRMSTDSSREASGGGHTTTLGSFSGSATSVAPLGLGKRPLPSASVIYTGGQVGYSRSSQNVAERVDTTMSVLRALHNAKLAEAKARRRGSEVSVSMGSVAAYDTSNKTVHTSAILQPVPEL